MSALQATDPQVAEILSKEALRQASVLRMIPSENYTSPAVMEITGSCLTNKYSEGYPGRRYYQGQEFIDDLEILAMERAKAISGAEHANVQPYSGSPANMAVYLALLDPGDKVMGMDLAAGGHLTHGSKVSFSGQLYTPGHYGLDKKTGRIDLAEVRKQAKLFAPKLMFAGCSSYPRSVDFAGLAEIAHEAGARLAADISHISGLCFTGLHPDPVPYADVVTTTTHKILRGPRGGMILCKKELAPAINKAVFPGMQGGPHNHVTGGIAVALHEAGTENYAQYCQLVLDNAQALARGLLSHGFTLVTGGTDNHMVLIDMTSRELTGKAMAVAMERAGIVANANKIPFDCRPAHDPSGVRLGTPALASRGMGTDEMKQIAAFLADIAENPQDGDMLDGIRAEVAGMCARFPAPVSGRCKG